MNFPVPNNEPQRLRILDAYDVVGTPPEMDFDEIAEMAAQICGCPVAVINVIADKWEWYKGKCGIPDDVNREPRGGICSTTICSNNPLIVPDLSKDERFAAQDVVKGEPYFRFYAGLSMINPDGYALGSLCVLDYEPREINAGQLQALHSLTNQAVAQLELRRKVAELDEIRRALADEKKKADDLLRNTLPDFIAEELKAQGRVEPRYHDSVSVLFTDFKDFTRMTERLEPRALIDELNDHFSAFDEIIARHGLEKLKTIGDAYMCAAGLRKRTRQGAEEACTAALAIRDYMAKVNETRRKLRAQPWEIRIGVHTGGVIAGVVGRDRFAYDIWGDAVNVAALMEAHAQPGEILLSDSTKSHLGERFETAPRDEIDTVKKGRIGCHVLLGAKA